MVRDVADDRVVEDGPTKLSDKCADLFPRFLTFAVGATKPEFNFKADRSAAVVLQVFLPYVEHACFFDSVLDSPSANIFEAEKHVPELGKPMVKRHVLIVLIPLPQ